MLASARLHVSTGGRPGRRLFSLRPSAVALCTSAGRDRLAAFRISQPPLHCCDPRTHHSFRFDTPMQQRRDNLVGLPFACSPVLRLLTRSRLSSRRCLRLETTMTHRFLVLITAICPV